MKRVILLVVFVGVFSWALYDFLVDKDAGEVDEDGGVMIKAEADPDASEEATATGDEDEVGLEVGNLAPDFVLNTFEGGQAKLSDYRGEQVMLNFWATWCPPCRAEMPDMQKFYEDEEVVILAVNLTQTQNEMENIPGFIEEFDLTFPVLLDEELDVSLAYKIQPIPTTYMIDSTGHISDKSFGPMNYEMMVQKLAAMK